MVGSCKPGRLSLGHFFLRRDTTEGKDKFWNTKNKVKNMENKVKFCPSTGQTKVFFRKESRKHLRAKSGQRQTKIKGSVKAILKLIW